MNRFGDIDVSFKQLPPVYGYRSEKLVSIEKALESVESQINELPYYIKTAKRHCHFPSEHGLTKDQSAAVYIYTMEWGETTLYRVLNQSLRSENRQVLKIWFPYLKLFDTALDKLPTVKEILWRGVPLDIGKSFTKNQLVTWWSVNSCSSSVDVIKDFLGNNKNSTLFLIEATNGKKVSGYTEYEKEDEIILRMGTQFRIKSNALEQSNGSHIVHLVEIDDNNDEPLSSTMIQMHVAPKPSNQDASVSPECKNAINSLNYIPLIKSGKQLGGTGGHNFDDFIESNLTYLHYLRGMITGCKDLPLDWCQFCYSSSNDDCQMIMQSEIRGTCETNDDTERFIINENERINKIQVVVDHEILFVNDIQKIVPLIRGIRFFTTNGQTSQSIDHLQGDLYTEELYGYFVGYVTGRSGLFIDQLQFYWFKNNS
ncbi:unnamed protein product [Adineta steineri]|uniref:NAD(P)(+)--arginine ADP-ribosyltransferase n=1 Tax=Adineta steineri TaxID=433720 RepID=A0A815MH71_9BILA|nr:unnamed protein product [Adineta steineri]CAF1419404.1 unnamed protein product [Adineta steineri]CAF3718575.1 unnamed protein product [Adineta steineri]